MKLDPSKAPEVRKLLEHKGFQFTDNEHAFWKARRGTATVIFYRSGSVLIQGSGNDKRTAEELIAPANPVRPAPGKAAAVPTLGMDESGKGDYFGPLVLAAVLLKPAESDRLRASGVRDSKTLSDEQIASLAPLILESAQVETRILVPEEYNALYSQYGNLNLMMKDAYIELMGRFPASGYEKAVLDKFSQSAAQNAEIVRSAQRPLLIVEKAESSYPAVAAASVVARHRFVEWMKEASAKNGMNIPKGSGPGARALFVKLRGRNETLFRSLAKTHFKG